MSTFKAPRKLTPEDDLGAFHCGIDAVDDWVRTRAHDAERRRTAIAYVACCDGAVAGIYSLSAHSIVRDEVRGGWLRRNSPESIPAVLLGMLGVDIRFQGLGLGRSLLADAIRRSLSIADQIGAKALVVDPANTEAQRFYEKYGFKPIPGMIRMYIPLR